MKEMRLAVVFLSMMILLTCAHQAERCSVCQREVHASVRAVLTLPDGERITTCCPRCALHYQVESGKRAAKITVTDDGGGGMLPLGRAFLVEGSDETPCTHHAPMADAGGGPMRICYDRCMPSLIAFRDETAARGFAAVHGGTVFVPGEFPGLEKTASPTNR
jgi:hypothetical protein